MAKKIGPKCQLNSAGYVRNKRQHAAFGFAIIELAQTLKAVWKEGKNQVSGKASSGNLRPHEFGWRDMYDVLVKWRQYSEVRFNPKQESYLTIFLISLMIRFGGWTC